MLQLVFDMLQLVGVDWENLKLRGYRMYRCLSLVNLHDKLKHIEH